MEDTTLEEYLQENNKYDTRDKCLYVIKCGKYFKIGSAFDPYKRISDLGIGNPYEIIIYRIYEHIPNEDCIYCEWAIHQELKDYHHKGEWFKCTIVIITRAINKVFRERKAYNKRCAQYKKECLSLEEKPNDY